MGCEKHSQRTRKDCLACNPLTAISEKQFVKEKRIVKEPAKKGKISKETVARAIAKVSSERSAENQKKIETKIETKINNTVYKPLIPISSSDEVDREVRIEVSKIREYVDSVFGQALEKIKQEINLIKSVKWEHAIIPMTVFNVDLLLAIGKDGWKLVDFMRNAKQYGYSDVPDYATIQRIVKSDNEPLPDMSKPGAVRKYLEKINGTK